MSQDYEEVDEWETGIDEIEQKMLEMQQFKNKLFSEEDDQSDDDNQNLQSLFNKKNKLFQTNNQ